MDQFREWENEFEDVNSDSFTAQKLYLINPLRRRFQLKVEKQQVPKEKASKPVVPGTAAKPKMVKPVMGKPAVKPKMGKPVIKTSTDKPPTAKPVIKPKMGKPVIKPKMGKPVIKKPKTDE